MNLYDTLYKNDELPSPPVVEVPEVAPLPPISVFHGVKLLSDDTVTITNARVENEIQLASSKIRVVASDTSMTDIQKRAQITKLASDTADKVAELTVSSGFSEEVYNYLKVSISNLDKIDTSQYDRMPLPKLEVVEQAFDVEVEGMKFRPSTFDPTLREDVDITPASTSLDNKTGEVPIFSDNPSEVKPKPVTLTSESEVPISLDNSSGFKPKPVTLTSESEVAINKFSKDMKDTTEILVEKFSEGYTELVPNFVETVSSTLGSLTESVTSNLITKVYQGIVNSDTIKYIASPDLLVDKILGSYTDTFTKSMDNLAFGVGQLTSIPDDIVNTALDVVTGYGEKLGASFDTFINRQVSGVTMVVDKWIKDIIYPKKPEISEIPLPEIPSEVTKEDSTVFEVKSGEGITQPEISETPLPEIPSKVTKEDSTVFEVKLGAGITQPEISEIPLPEIPSEVTKEDSTVFEVKLGAGITQPGKVYSRDKIMLTNDSIQDNFYWSIDINPVEFGGQTPPSLKNGREVLPVISYTLNSEAISNSEYELYPGINTFSPSGVTFPTRLNIILPNLISHKNGVYTSMVQNFKDKYLAYVSCQLGNEFKHTATPIMRDFRYCTYTISVIKYTNNWSPIKMWRLLGIPEFTTSDGGGESQLETSELSFAIIGTWHMESNI